MFSGTGGSPVQEQLVVRDYRAVVSIVRARSWSCVASG